MNHHPRPKHREYGRPAKELWRHKTNHRLLVTELKSVFQEVAGNLKNPDMGIVLLQPKMLKDLVSLRMRQAFADVMAATDVSPLRIVNDAHVRLRLR